MSEALEALEHIYYGSQGYGETDKYYEYLKNYLESIDNANPSEALECWNKIGDILNKYCNDKGLKFSDSYNISQELQVIKQALLKAQEQEKVLKILKEKRVDLPYLRCCFEDNQNVERYNEYIRSKTMDYDHEEELTQEEFELLRWYFK